MSFSMIPYKYNPQQHAPESVTAPWGYFIQMICSANWNLLNRFVLQLLLKNIALRCHPHRLIHSNGFLVEIPSMQIQTNGSLFFCPQLNL